MNSKNNPFKAFGPIPEKRLYEDYTISSTFITVRDGVKIAASICLPKGLSPDKKIPTLLYQTRYWRATNFRIPFRWILDELTGFMPSPEIFTSRGYAIVYIDVRGTGTSLGTRPYPFSDEEVKDGADIADWIISQPWSDGSIVSNGISYSGITAELLGVNNHPAVKAVMPGHGLWDGYTDVAFPGGCYDRGFMQLWSFLGENLDQNNPKVLRQFAPLNWLFSKSVKPVESDKDLSVLKEAAKVHENNQYVYDITINKDYSDDELPNGASIKNASVYLRKGEIERSNVPVLGWCSWLDSGYVDVIIHRFMNLSNPQVAILGDWTHGARYPANQFFPERTVVSPTPRERVNTWVNFFDKCVKGEGIQGKVLYYYTMVEEKWKKTNVWPPAGQKMKRWYLRENNSLSTTMPEEESGDDSYKINYRATTGRNNRWWALLGLPIMYENRNKADEKLLVYDSSPLEKDMEITGNAIICLHVSSTHEDGALFAYLEEIDEKGKVTYITDGQLRVIHRKVSTEEPPYKTCVPFHTFKKKDSEPLKPGEIAEIKFGLYSTSVLIRKGHKLRIAIAGSDKDTFIRYPSEGRPTITISRNKIHASYIDLPIIPKDAS